MSTCISWHGEYSSHSYPEQATEVHEEFICTLCGALDEDAVFAEIERLRRESVSK